jgi:hypothetical protein
MVAGEAPETDASLLLVHLVKEPYLLSSMFKVPIRQAEHSGFHSILPVEKG